MNPEAKFVDEPCGEEEPSQLAAAVHQQDGRKLGFESRDGFCCVAVEASLPLERAVQCA
jgi:hypothetical protein